MTSETRRSRRPAAPRDVEAEIHAYVTHAEAVLRRLAARAGGDDLSDFYRPGETPMKTDDQSVRSLHVPLDWRDGHDPTGRLAQPSMVDAVIRSAATRPRTVVEIGCGEGFNTMHLARTHPDIGFVGLELIASHLAAVSRDPAPASNARFVLADFHHLPLAGGVADVVFSVEAIIHARDMRGVLTRLHQILRPGGELFVIELFRSPRLPGLRPELQHACAVTEQLLAIPAMWGVEEWTALAGEVGFAPAGSTELTAAAVAKLAILTRWGERALRRPEPPPDAVAKSILGGLLICRTLQAGGHGLYANRLTRT